MEKKLNYSNRPFLHPPNFSDQFDGVTCSIYDTPYANENESGVTLPPQNYSTRPRRSTKLSKINSSQPLQQEKIFYSNTFYEDLAHPFNCESEYDEIVTQKKRLKNDSKPVSE